MRLIIGTALVPSLIHTANNNDDDPEAELADKEPSIEEDSEITFGPGDVEFADTVLMYSQKLADKGEFKKAITQIKRIKEEDPAFKKQLFL